MTIKDGTHGADVYAETIPYLGTTLTVTMRMWRKDPVDFSVNFDHPYDEWATHGAVNFQIRHAFLQGSHEPFRLELTGARVRGVIEYEYTVPKSSKLWQQVYRDFITIAQRLTDPDGPAVKDLTHNLELKRKQDSVFYLRQRIERIEADHERLPEFRDELVGLEADLASFTTDQGDQ